MLPRLKIILKKTCSSWILSLKLHYNLGKTGQQATGLLVPVICHKSAFLLMCTESLSEWFQSHIRSKCDGWTELLRVLWDSNSVTKNVNFIYYESRTNLLAQMLHKHNFWRWDDHRKNISGQHVKVTPLWPLLAAEFTFGVNVQGVRNMCQRAAQSPSSARSWATAWCWIHGTIIFCPWEYALSSVWLRLGSNISPLTLENTHFGVRFKDAMLRRPFWSRLLKMTWSAQRLGVATLLWGHISQWIESMQ